MPHKVHIPLVHFCYTAAMSTTAVIRTTYADVREEPNQRSELFTQLLLGDVVAILEEKDRWVRVRLFDQNEGWIHRGYLHFGEGGVDEISTANRICVTSLIAQVFSRPDAKSPVVIVATEGTMLTTATLQGHWYEVVLPDGQRGWVFNKHVRPAVSLPRLSGEEIVKRARRFLGVPYLWGGTTSVGLDCSGLTQHCYRVLGKILPRNSSQQAETGEAIDSGADWSNLHPGDLLFFAENERVDHVAISTGGPGIIHAALSNGMVKEENLTERLKQMFHSARRIV